MVDLAVPVGWSKIKYTVYRPNGTWKRSIRGLVCHDEQTETTDFDVLDTTAKVNRDPTARQVLNDES